MEIENVGLIVALDTEHCQAVVKTVMKVLDT